MAIRELRGGVGSARAVVREYMPKLERARVPEDRVTVRLVTRMHLGGIRKATAPFCVVGLDVHHNEALVYLAESRADATKQMAAVRDQFAAVHVRQWTGSVRCGCWRTVVARVRPPVRARRAASRPVAG
jgi:hypothetical protein